MPWMLIKDTYDTIFFICLGIYTYRLHIHMHTLCADKQKTKTNCEQKEFTHR